MANRNVITNQRQDVLDQVFEWTEKFLCPFPKNHDQMRNMPEPKEDMLDYVFQHTESLVCHQEGSGGTPHLLEEGQELEHDIMLRDNSLIAAPGEQIMTTTKGQKRPIKSMGQEGDFIDYVFEHVESLVCVERSKMRSALENAPQQAGIEVDIRTGTDLAHSKRGEHFVFTEQEEEIQVEFRRAKSWSR